MALYIFLYDLHKGVFDSQFDQWHTIFTLMEYNFEFITGV